MRRWLLVAALLLTACSHRIENATVTCVKDGAEFSARFDAAQIESDGRARAWLDGQSVVIDAECAIAAPAAP